jgi:N-acetylmuramoyl-L-alanine amidase
MLPWVLVSLVSFVQGAKTSPPRDLEKIKGIMIHRIDVGETGEDVVRAFNKTAKFAAGSYTGGYVGYTFIIRRDGLVDQLRQLNQVTMHSIGYNHTYIGVAVVGDFNKHQPTPAQWDSLVELCYLLSLQIGPNWELHGHTELPGASRDPKKICPGKFLDLKKLEAEIRATTKRRIVEELTSQGVVIT